MWLRAGRAQRNLSIADVARVTKIQPRILEKLESGQLDGLPAPVFVRGFVRSFAKCVGLSESEALERLSAAQSGQAINAPTPEQVLANGTGAVSAPVPEPEPVPVPVSASEPEPEPEPVSASEAVSASEPEPEPEPVPVSASETVSAPATVSASAAASSARTSATDGKKKRSRRKRKKKATSAPALQTATETTARHAHDADVAIASSLATGDASADDGVVATPALAAGSERISASAIDTTAATAASEPLAASEIDTTAGDAAEPAATSGTWQPTMPPLPTMPSVPWRRPHLPAQAAYVVPSLVIDDSDPESADRAREERTSRDRDRDQARLSFLPPILLDREDRTARQGGLTLAVIILLIAATLTLSYLMRRPSPSGDGVTMLDGQTSLVS